MSVNLRTKKSIMLLIRGSVTLIVAGIFAFTWLTYYHDIIANPFYRKGNWLFILLYMIIYHIFTVLYGGYRIGTERLTDIIYSNWLSLFIANCIAYAQIILIARGLQPVPPIIRMTFIQATVIFIWGFLINRLYFHIFPPLRLVCLYSSEYPGWLLEKFSMRPEKFCVISARKVTEKDNSYQSVVADADGVLIHAVEEDKKNEILKYCVDNRKRYYLVPSLGNILLRTSDIIYLFDMPMLLSKNQGLTPEQRLMKRLMDILAASVLLVVSTIPMLITALAIKLCDRGSVLYTQPRCTLDGKVFNIYKFRSMKKNAEQNGIVRLTKENDPRITPVGRVIRRFRIDELPQLFNILRGDMSLVGPRPERPEIMKEYEKTLPEFRERLAVKCGLTGFAQVMGTYDTPPLEKLKLDLIYIQHYSVLLDIKILLKTIKIILVNADKVK